jgi:hypothetical protein
MATTIYLWSISESPKPSQPNHDSLCAKNSSSYNTSTAQRKLEKYIESRPDNDGTFSSGTYAEKEAEVQIYSKLKHLPSWENDSAIIYKTHILTYTNGQWLEKWEVKNNPHDLTFFIHFYPIELKVINIDPPILPEAIEK